MVRRVPRAVLFLALLSACGAGRGGCGGCGAVAIMEDAGDDDGQEASAKLAGDDFVAERCHFEGDALSLAPTSAGPVEVGRPDARSVSALELGIATLGVGEVLTIGTATSVAAPMRLTISGRTTVGPLAADAPPPRAFALTAGAFALFYPAFTRDGGAATKRHLRFVALDGSPRVARTLADLPDESIDESLAYDGALRDGPVTAGALGPPEGLFAWDDDDGDRGVIKVALYQSGTIVPAQTLASARGDASSPRVLLRPDGYAVYWKVRRDETTADGSPKLSADEAIEGPGELRGFEWLEWVKVALDGKPRGTPTKLTPAEGHVGSFDVVGGGFGVPSNDADVYARDAAQRGQLVHIAVRDDAVTSTTPTIPAAAVGLPTLLRFTNDATLLTYDDPTGHALFVPIDPARGEPTGRPSDEGTFAAATVLWAPGAPSLGGDPQWPATLLLLETGAAPAGTRLRVAICAK
ncbi:hypothetical protein BH09MYX1_BH09MYX1_30650 [soil metagenome]